MSEGRGLPAVQRAYLYVVALVAIHMVVLAVANLLRVGAELAMNASSGGFTGLPFLFADFSQPRELYREQASLAIALLVIGAPAWWLSYRAAERAAGQDDEARGSAIRSLYVHLVIFVTALLVFGYGQRTLSLILQGSFGAALPEGFLEAEWQARAAGAAAMAVAAAGALAYHLRISRADRRALLVRGRAAELRHLVFYGLVVIGLFFAAFSASFTVNGLWDRLVADRLVPIDRFGQFGSFPGRQTNPDDVLRFQLLGQIPPIVAGLALWLGTWLPLQRGMRDTRPDGEIERRSVVRKLAIYVVVGVSAVTVLISATIGFAAVIRRLLGDAFQEQFTSLPHDLGFPLSFTIVFATLWMFHRRVIEAEATRETELARAADIRRLYTYLISAIGLAMTAVGAAGTIGVFGSQVMGMNTHANGETAAYLALVLVGLPAWGFHWFSAQRRLDDLERGAIQRRGYLYLAVLGGAIGLLVFGSAALYRLFNAALAADFPLSTWHDIWHFVVDAAVSGAAFTYHLAIIRSERVVTAPAAVVPGVFAFLVRFPATDAESARARVAAALPDARVTPLKGDTPGALAIEAGLTPADAAALEAGGGPGAVAVAVAALAALLLVVFLATSVLPMFFLSRPPSEPVRRPAGELIWAAALETPGSSLASRQATGGASVTAARNSIIVNLPQAGRAELVFDQQLTPPFEAVAVIVSEPGTDATLVWTVTSANGESIGLRISYAEEVVEIVRIDTTSPSEIIESLAKPIPLRDVGFGRAVEYMLVAQPPRYELIIDGQLVTTIGETRASGAPSAFAISVREGAGTLHIVSLRAHRVH